MSQNQIDDLGEPLEPPAPLEASEHDLRCATACTKAGLTALLFSALAISLLQPLEKKKSVDALEEYISLRLTLNSAISQLGEDSCWKSFQDKIILGRFKFNNKDLSFPDKTKLATLLEYQCKNDILHEKTKRQIQQEIERSNLESIKINKELWELRRKESPDNKSQGTAASRGPGPPTGGSVARIRDLDGAREILSSLAIISNRNLLRQAQQASIRYNHYINGWRVLLYKITKPYYASEGLKNVDKWLLAQMDIDKEKIKIKDPRFLYLTLEDAKKLSSYDLPSITEIERPISEQVQFNLSPTSPLLSLEAATAFVEIVILLSLIYFLSISV